MPSHSLEIFKFLEQTKFLEVSKKTDPFVICLHILLQNWTFLKTKGKVLHNFK